MSASDPPSDRAVRVLAAVTYALGAALTVISAWVIVARLRYPIDAEWMTGAIRDGVERVRDGKPLYGPPSATFIAFVYPPLYFWLSGLLSKVVSSFVACKVVSIGAAAVTGWGLYRVSRQVGATPRWSRIALVLFVATYPLTLLFYDLERVDSLYAALIVTGIAVLFSSRSTAATVAAGALLGLAFFAKQAGLLTLAGAVLGLVLAGERKRAAIVLGAGVAVLAVVGIYLEVSTAGWFRYYCVKLPGTHGIRPQRLSIFFIQDAPKAFAITAASVALSSMLAVGLVRHRTKPEGMSWPQVVLATIVGAAMLAAFSFRAHSGGWANVLVAWLPLGCPAFAIVATRMEEWAAGTRAQAATSLTLLGAVSLQILGAMFDPTELAPNADDMRDHDRFVGLVRALEQEGEVMVLPTGHLTKQTTAHSAALYDVLRAGDHAPADLLSGLESRRWAAIFVDVPVDCDFPQCDELEVTLARNYFVAGRRHERDRTGMTGYDARPRWLFRPRKAPLASMSPKDLITRQRVEKALAEARTTRLAQDEEIRPADDLEALAADAR